MNYKLLFSSLIIALLFFTTLSAQQNNTIDVVGMAECSLTPDQVSIHIVIEKKGATAKQAQKMANEAATNTLEYLQKNKAITKTKSDYINLHKRVNYNNKEENFVATQQISFILTDLNQYEETIITLLESGVDGINRVTFLSSKQEEATDKLWAKAVQNAKQKATHLAAQLNQNIGKATYISDRVMTNSNTPSPYLRSADFQAESIGIAPGELKTSVSLNIIFELK